MGTIAVIEFTGGLDTRRMPEATSGGVLIKANNGHITRGGEFEQRAAFVLAYELPEGTVAMTATPAGLVVFGHTTEPVGIPVGVTYQRLEHPTPATALVRVLSTDLYAGKIYAVGEFADGSIHHYYDGVLVTDWFDGRARATFEVTGGGVDIAVPAVGSFDITAGTAGSAAVSATGSFAVTGGTSGVGNEITDVLVDGVDVLGATVAHTGNNTTTAANIAAQITSNTSSPNYTAVAVSGTVTITAVTPGTAANGRVVDPNATGDVTFGSIVDMADGAAAVVNDITSVTIDGVEVLGATVNHTGTNSTTATAVAAQITTYVSIPDYTATADGQTVTIVAAVAGSAPNGKVIVPTDVGDVTTANIVNMADGADIVTSTVSDIKINGVSVISAPVSWVDSNEDTAVALAAAINSFTSTPDYTATSVGPSVSIAATDPGPAPNGFVVNFTLTNGFDVTPDSLTMADGADSATAYQPGEFVKTLGKKEYSVSGPNLHFSGIQEPTKWTTDAVGAGFIDMSTESAGSEALTALARYQNFLAVFASRVIQIWFIDPDPELNRQAQVLSNTGTESPRSVTAFGDADIFYLDESGLRSLRARDSSNSAATTDIGVPVDNLITAKLATLNDNERRLVIGLIEPGNGRFWLIMKDQIFVFSFFTGAKVSAWSTYDTSYLDEDDETVAFDVDDAAVFSRRVYLRSGDNIFVYGGLGDATYDATVAEAWLPSLDANDPTRKKQMQGIDIALRGIWEAAAAMDPTNELAEDKIGVFDQTTYNLDGAMPFFHQATHVSLRFRSSGTNPAGGAHRLGACVVHYTASDDDD